MKNYYVGTPNLPDKKQFTTMLNKLWKTKQLTNDGPYVREFEKQIQQFLNVPYAIVVCNATIGLQILARAVFDYNLYITPAFTFVATVYALQWVGFRPIFADIDLLTHNIHLTRSDFPIIATHVWGRPCEIDIIQQNKVPIIFDAAHAFGCSYNGVKIGNFGDGEVFSFHATKFINSFEGGVITTKSEEIANKCRLFRNFGFVDYDDSACIGINGKMNEIQAAMGLCSLDEYDKIVEHNKKNYEMYCDNLYNIEGLKMISYDLNTTPNYQYIVIEVEKNRDVLHQFLWKNNIFTRRYFYPGVHKMKMYNNTITLPNTELLASKVLALPTGTSISEKDVNFICKTIRKVI